MARAMVAVPLVDAVEGRSASKKLAAGRLPTLAGPRERSTGLAARLRFGDAAAVRRLPLEWPPPELSDRRRDRARCVETDDGDGRYEIER